MALFPWPLVLFQYLFVIPRYDRLFRQMGLRVDSITDVLIDVSAWVRAHVLLVVQLTFLLALGSAGVAYFVQVTPVSRGRRLLALLVVFGVPCALFVLSWVGITETQRRLAEGLKK